MGVRAVGGLIDQRHIDAALQAGACEMKYHAGQPLSDLTWIDAVWVDDHLSEIAAEIAKREGRPVWALATGGYGGVGYGGDYGDGYGDDGGYGDGVGVGGGDGYGVGDGGYGVGVGGYGYGGYGVGVGGYGGYGYGVGGGDGYGGGYGGDVVHREGDE